MKQMALKWSIEPNVLYQVELEVEKGRDLGKSNISRKDNIQKCGGKSLQNVLGNNKRSRVYSREQHEVKMKRKIMICDP